MTSKNSRPKESKQHTLQPTRITWPFQDSEREDREKLEQLLQDLEEVRLNVTKQLRNVYEKKGIPANRIKQFGQLVDWSESETESKDDESMEDQ